MEDKVLGKFIIYVLLIVIVTQPPLVLVVSQEHNEDSHKEISFQNIHPAAWINPPDSPFAHIEFEKEEHTHQEDQSPRNYRYLPEAAIGTASSSPSEEMDEYDI